MSELGTFEEAEAFRAERVKKSSADERLAWLRQMQELAYKSGAWERAVRAKQDNEWKYGK